MNGFSSLKTYELSRCCYGRLPCWGSTSGDTAGTRRSPMATITSCSPGNAPESYRSMGRTGCMGFTACAKLGPRGSEEAPTFGSLRYSVRSSEILGSQDKGMAMDHNHPKKGRRTCYGYIFVGVPLVNIPWITSIQHAMSQTSNWSSMGCEQPGVQGTHSHMSCDVKNRGNRTNRATLDTPETKCEV